MARSRTSSGVIALTVNGKVQKLEEPTVLEQFLRNHDVDIKFVAVAYNGTVLRREEFGEVILSEGDTVEIVRPVGGG